MNSASKWHEIVSFLDPGLKMRLFLSQIYLFYPVVVSIDETKQNRPMSPFRLQAHILSTCFLVNAMLTDLPSSSVPET